MHYKFPPTNDFTPGSADEPVLVVAFADIDSDRNRIRHMIKRHQFVYGSVNRAKVESGELDLHVLHERLHARSAPHDHEHAGNPHRQALDTPTDTRVRVLAESPAFSSPQGAERVPSAGHVPPVRFRPAPTPEQAAAAWSADLRNPRFVEESRGTTVIVDEQDYRGGFEMV
jgi:hypothetical protein